MRNKWQMGWLLGIIALLAGCATVPTLPPAKPIQDLKDIAGKWAGQITTRGGSSSYALTINGDGSWEATAPNISPGNFKGIMRVSGDKVLFRSYTTGRTGIVTLHESEGKRTLVLSIEDGGVRAELTPAR